MLMDYKPLYRDFTSHLPLKSNTQHRHLSFISAYITDIFHIKGHENIIAESLSRPANVVTIDPCDFLTFA